MITFKDKVEQFKRACKSYNHYKNMIMDCEDRLYVIAHKLKGVSSVSPKGVIYENCGDPYKEQKNEYLTKEQEIIVEKRSYEVSNENVDKILKLIDDTDKCMIEDRFINKKYYKRIVDKYSYNDISAIDKHIDSVLYKLFKKLES